MAAEPMRDTARLWPGALVLLLPLVGLALLIARPEFDLHWEHHPSHFWIVLIAAAVNVVLAYVTNIAAGRYRDARLTLISLAFLASAGFLGLHALATPAVLLPEANIGFAIATPVGLIIASVFAAASATPLAGPRAMDVLRVRTALLWGLIGFMALWAVVLDRPGAAPRRPSPTQRRCRRPGHSVHRRRRPLRVRRRAADPAVPVSRRSHPAGDGGRTRAARRGTRRDGRQPELAFQLVGVAPTAAGRLCDHRACGTARVPATRIAGRSVRRPVSRCDIGQCRALVRVCGRVGRRGRVERWLDGARPRPACAAKARPRRSWRSWPRQLARSAGSTRPSDRTCRPSSGSGSAGAAAARHRSARNGSSASCSPTCPASRRSASAMNRARSSRCSTPTGPRSSRSSTAPAGRSSTSKAMAC